MWDKYRCNKCDYMFKPYFCQHCDSKIYTECNQCHSEYWFNIWLAQKFGYATAREVMKKC